MEERDRERGMGIASERITSLSPITYDTISDLDMATWTTCFGGTAQRQLVHAGQAVRLRITVLPGEQVLQGARTGSRVTTVDHHAQVLGHDGRPGAVLQLCDAIRTGNQYDARATTVGVRAHVPLDTRSTSRISFRPSA